MVTQSVVFGLLAGIMWGVGITCTAVAVRRIGTFQVLFWAHVASVIAGTVYLVVEGGLVHLSLDQWGRILLLCLIAISAAFAYFEALRRGPVSIVAPIESAYAAVTILLAVILVGDRMTVGQTLGTTVAIGGIVLASVDLRSLHAGRHLIGEGVILALIAMVLVGSSHFLLGSISQDIGWFTPVYIWRLLTLALLSPIALAQRRWPWRRHTVGLAAVVALIGLLEVGGLSIYARGTEIGVISIVAAASTTYPLVPILGGLVIFRERMAPNQMVGVATVLGGLLLLSLG